MAGLSVVVFLVHKISFLVASDESPETVESVGSSVPVGSLVVAVEPDAMEDSDATVVGAAVVDASDESPETVESIGSSVPVGSLVVALEPGGMEDSDATVVGTPVVDGSEESLVVKVGPVVVAVSVVEPTEDFSVESGVD